MAKHVPSAAATGSQGPQDATGPVAGHFHGRGGERLPHPDVRDPDGDGDDDRTPGGQADDANRVAGG
jgi:hypothetical protein